MTSKTKAAASRGQSVSRCAIYTRKSTDEGLEQDFNSLDAQREACEAFIRSQKHEGWQVIAAHYDDGGYSGGNLERPAFTRLLKDIESGQINTVVVYKVDRLTRSLHDFARIVEVFERRQVSFVSVTQQFNTTTSMGRLTLNMLLSFAQFEREVTGERIRDKIAASKRKGMWMGGNVPLGYDSVDRKLVINESESALVKEIFRRYLRLGSVRELKDSLDHDGFVSKKRTDRFGRTTGGRPFARGALYKMLQNRIYRGEIVHKDQSYPGEHEAIVDEDLWQRVQQRLSSHRVERRLGSTAAEPGLLTGLIYDDAGQRMTPTHAIRNDTRYRYYVSQTLTTKQRNDHPRGRRVPARDLESLVEERLLKFLGNESELFDAIRPNTTDTAVCVQHVQTAAALAEQWGSLEPMHKRAWLLALIRRIEFADDVLNISVRSGGLPQSTDAVRQPPDQGGLIELLQPEDESPIISLTTPAYLRRAGTEMRLLIDGAGGGSRNHSDHALCRLLAQASRFRSILFRAQGRSMSEAAAEAGVTHSYFTRVLSVSFLAPEIVQSMLANRHPVTLTARRLSKNTKLPLSWDEQRSLLGFD